MLTERFEGYNLIVAQSTASPKFESRKKNNNVENAWIKSLVLNWVWYACL
jgi:hypothetical protein